MVPAAEVNPERRALMRPPELETRAPTRGEQTGETGRPDENGDAMRPREHAAPLAARDSRSSEPAAAETSAPASRALAVSDARATLTEITRLGVQATTRSEAGARRQPTRSREPFGIEPEAPRISVSIGRIEVEIAPPPAPTVAPSRPHLLRTRGFEAYARARRGQPR
jgi:hypothetical protein